jgi:hypothetical protein
MQDILATIKEAVVSKDLSTLTSAMSQLSELLGSDQSQILVRTQILPSLSIRELLWFWRSVTSPIQQFQLLNQMSERATTELMRGGFALGKDFSFTASDEGESRLMLTADAKKHLEMVMTTDKLVTLALLTRHKHIRV